MKYSVIVPVYNAENEIIECVNSILDSGLYDYEILLIDDGSIDNSARICKQLEKKYPSIKYLYQKNSGVSCARNSGIKNAQGEFIIFCDVDDMFEKGCFQKLEEYITPDTDAVIYGISMEKYFRGICYSIENLALPLKGLITQNEWQSCMLQLFDCNALTPVWNKVYKSSIIKDSGLLFNEKLFLLEDFVFSVEYLFHCRSIFFMDKTAYHYKQTDNYISSVKRLKRIDSINEYVDIIANHIMCHIPEDRGIDKGLVIILLYRIYYMILSQKAYYEKPYSVDVYADEMLKSSYCNEKYVKLVGEGGFHLYSLLKEKKFNTLRIDNLYTYIRHYLAVRYKYWKTVVMSKP